MKKVVISIVIVVAIALVVGFVPLVEAEYRHTETYWEDEPYEVTETYYETEPLEYRELDSFTTEAVNDVRGRAAMRGYDLPDGIVEWPNFAVYVVVENLDDVLGAFEIRYTCIGTADKVAAEKYQWLTQLTPEEYQELDIKCNAGSRELYLQPSEVGVAMCPRNGASVGSDRVPWWSGGYEVIPGTKTVEKQRMVTEYRHVERERLVIQYRKVPIFEYLRSR